MGTEVDVDELFSEKPLQLRKYGCTVVSLLPREIFEEKPHMLPSSFRIPAAEYGDISIIHVEEGIHYVPNPFDPGSLKQTTSPAEMARSIVDDYVTAHICLGDNCGPGLFWVEGRLTVKEVKDNYRKKLKEYKEKQDNWFHALCAMADADWHKNHNMLAVSDLQRMAARSLGLVDRYEWVQLQTQVTIECPFCKFRITPDSVKCLNCREVVNQKAYERLTGVKTNGGS